MRLDIGLLPREVQRPFEQLQAQVIDTGGTGLHLRTGTATVPVVADTFGNLADIPHGLGRLPHIILLTSSTRLYLPAPGDITDTTFRIDIDHIEAVSQTLDVDVYWMAIG